MARDAYGAVICITTHVHETSKCFADTNMAIETRSVAKTKIMTEANSLKEYKTEEMSMVGSLHSRLSRGCWLLTVDWWLQQVMVETTDAPACLLLIRPRDYNHIILLRPWKQFDLVSLHQRRENTSKHDTEKEE